MSCSILGFQKDGDLGAFLSQAYHLPTLAGGKWKEMTCIHI